MLATYDMVLIEAMLYKVFKVVFVNLDFEV